MASHSAGDATLNATVQLVLSHVGYLMATLDGPPPFMPMPDFNHVDQATAMRLLVKDGFDRGVRGHRTGRFLSPVHDLALVAEQHCYTDQLYFLVTLEPVDMSGLERLPVGSLLYQVGNRGQQALLIRSTASRDEVVRRRRLFELEHHFRLARPMAEYQQRRMVESLVREVEAIFEAHPDDERVRHVQSMSLDDPVRLRQIRLFLSPLVDDLPTGE